MRWQSVAGALGIAVGSPSQLGGERCEPLERSGRIGLGPDELAQRIDWQ